MSGLSGGTKHRNGDITVFVPGVTFAALVQAVSAAQQVRRSSFPDDPQAFTSQERRLTDALDRFDWSLT